MNGEQRTEFRVFFDKNYDLIFRNLLIRTRSHADAEELVQETFFRASKTYFGYDDRPSSGWLFTIADNVFKNWLRYHKASKREGVETPIDDCVFQPEISQTPEKGLISKQEVDEIKAVIQSLPPQMRRCFVHYFFHDFKYQDIAILMGINVQTVKSQVSRARKKVVDLLKRNHN